MTSRLNTISKSFYIQLLGSRGAGKSTFASELFKEAGYVEYEPGCGSVETTLKTELYPITKAIKNKGPYNAVFVADQPGIGGTG